MSLLLWPALVIRVAQARGRLLFSGVGSKQDGDFVCETSSLMCRFKCRPKMIRRAMPRREDLLSIIAFAPSLIVPSRNDGQNSFSWRPSMGSLGCHHDEWSVTAPCTPSMGSFGLA